MGDDREGSKTAVQSKTSSSSPEKIEAKKRRKVDFIVDPMTLSEDLFKDKESYEEYLNKLKIMKHGVIGLVDDFLEIESEKDHLNTVLGERGTEKNLFERIKFCNLYRLQIDRFEIIFSKGQTFEVLTTFRQCLLLLIPVYEKERKSEKRKDIDSKKKHGAIFREEFSRVEKWTVIILWMYLIEYAQTKGAAGTMFESELEAIRSFAVEKKDEIIKDYDNTLKLPSLKAVNVLRGIFITTMKIDFSSKSCGAMMDEIKSIARSFNDAYQVCSREIKKIQNLTATPEEYIEIRVQINPCEVENDVLVAQCLDMMVNIGIHLATSTAKSINN